MSALSTSCVANIVRAFPESKSLTNSAEEHDASTIKTTIIAMVTLPMQAPRTLSLFV